MTQTFKVGDKVEHRSFGKGEIAFGPFDAAFDAGVFLMAAEDGKHYIAGTDALSRPAKFAVGDKVKSRYGTRYTVEAGPFFAPGEWYALRNDESCNIVHSNADEVSAVEPEPAEDAGIKPGDVVRILKTGTNSADVSRGDLLVVASLVEWSTSGDVYVHAAPGARLPEWFISGSAIEKVPADKVAVHDGVAYDLSAEYRDKEGDKLRIALVAGGARVAWFGAEPDATDETLAAALSMYGPFKRV